MSSPRPIDSPLEGLLILAVSGAAWALIMLRVLWVVS
jgi:hypothetical protein